MRWLLAAIQIVLATTFLVAGIGKWLQAQDFATALRSSHVPLGPAAVLGPRSLARNLALLSLAIVAVWLERANVSQLLPRPSVAAAISVTSSAMAVSLLVAFLRARPAMVLTSGDARRVEGEGGLRSNGGAPRRH